MLKKRTRLYTQFEFKNILHIINSFFTKKENFLNDLKKYLNKENIHLSSQGRVALFDIIKLIIANTGKKNFFIAPFTLPEVVYAIKYAGGNVIFIDIDKETGLIDSDELEKKINKETGGVVITHLYSSKESINKFITRFTGKIKIIEDAAINFGASVDDKFIGTLADYGFFSFNLVKNLNTLNGGAIFIKDKVEFIKYTKNSKKIKFPIVVTLNLILTVIILKILCNNFFYQIFHYVLDCIYKYRITFVLKKIYPVLFHSFKTNIPDNYEYDFNWLMNDLGVHNLKKINEDLNSRKVKAMLYQKHLSEKKIHKFNFLGKENIFLEYPVMLKNFTNLEMHKILFERGYDIRHTWYINNSLEVNKNLVFENTDYVAKNIFCLPTHKNISEKDIINICNIVNSHG